MITFLPILALPWAAGKIASAGIGCVKMYKAEPETREPVTYNMYISQTFSFPCPCFQNLRKTMRK